MRFRAVLKRGKWSHVAVSWDEVGIRLDLDGQTVESYGLGEPSGVGEPHRLSLGRRVLTGAPRWVALYNDSIAVGSVVRHYRAGLPLLTSAAAPSADHGGRVVAHAAAVPANTVLPAITGTAKDGQTLTSTTGTWSGSPTSYARQWLRCDTAGANCTNISGATSTTYVLTATDVGKTVRVKVTATNGSGSANVNSAQTATVVAAAPVVSAVPTISGTVKDGQTLTSTTGTWSGTATITYARQWNRCNSGGTGCVAISGATGTTYVVTAADIASKLNVTVTASNAAGSASSSSVVTALVTGAAPVNTAVPAITGTAKEGQLLSATTGTWTGTAPITYAYQWQGCNSSGASCVAISGATSATYRLVVAQVGKTIKVVVTATNGGGNASATSAASAVVTTGPPVSTGFPTVSGTAKDGQTLTTANGTWTGTATITYARQWKRCDTAGANCTNISAATGTTYILTSADVGMTVKATWTATNSLGSTSTDSAVTATVTTQMPANTALPAITGTAKDGQTLTVTNGTWTGSTPITYTREWKSCDTAGNNCTTITGATATTYTVTASEVGRKIRVTVTATNAAGTAAATSAATATVTANAPANLTVPAITGTAKDGLKIFATTGTWSGSGPLTYTYQWRRCDAAGANCANAPSNSSDYMPYSSDLGKTLRVVVTAQNAAGSASATSAQTAVVTTSPPVLNTPTDIRLVTTTAPPGALDETAAILGMDMGQSIASWWGSQPIDATYQWQRCDAAGNNCADIPGATGVTYEMRSTANLGATLRVRTTATNAYGTTPTVSDQSATITTGAPTNLTPPTAQGTARNHHTLTAQPGTWQGPLPTNLVEHYWYRCDTAAENCTKISETPTDDYETTDADVGHRLRVEEHVSYSDDPLSAYAGLGDNQQTGPPTDTIIASSTPPTIALSGDLVANPNAWLDADSYSLTVTATAGADTSGLTSLAVMYDGEQIATYAGCTGASCSVSHQLDIDTSEVADGDSALWVVATDADHTQTTEQRNVRFNRETPLSPQHVLVDMAADGITKLSWQHSNSPDAASYEVLSRSSSEEPFTVVATTEDDFYLDQPSGTGSLARTPAARIASTENALVGEEHVEYQVRAIDQAGQASPTTATVAATATETPAPAPASLTVQQISDSVPTQLTWDAAPGAARYGIYRALDADSDTMNNSGGTRGTPELIANVPATVTDYADKPDITGQYTYSIRTVGTTGQLGDTSPTTTTNLQSTKIPPSQEVLDHARDIEAALEDGGAPARERIPCTTKCKSLRTAERALDMVGRSADKVADQLAKLRGKVGSWPKLARIGELEVILIEEDVRHSIEIGTKLRKAYFTEKVPPPTPEIHGRKLVHGGDVAGTWICSPDWWNSACIGNGGTSIIGHLRARANAGTVAVGTNSSGGQILFESWGEDCSTTEQGPEPPATLPGGWNWLTDIGPCPVWWAGKAKHWVPFQRTRLDTPVTGPDGESESDHRVPTPNPGLTEAQAIQQLIDELQQSPDQYAALISWLEDLLGGDATAATPDGTPSCTSMTYQACVSAFEHAGFEGPFTKKTLEPDEAWIDESGGAVVDTTPYADDEPDADGPVEITVNPDVMPDWTIDDEQVDQHLETNHNNSPKKNDALDVETLRKNVARRCRIRATAAGFPLSDCWNLPIIVTGASDARGPAENDLQALGHNPRWIGLNRRYPVPNHSDWYRNAPGPGEGCLRENGTDKPFADAECHEYPFWSTQQANNGPLRLETPYVRWTHGRENGRQGNVLKHFYGEKLGRSMLFDGCSIPYPPVADDLTVLQRVAFPPTFLAIPVPIGLMPSFGICNDGQITG